MAVGTKQAKVTVFLQKLLYEQFEVILLFKVARLERDAKHEAWK